MSIGHVIRGRQRARPVVQLRGTAESSEDQGIWRKKAFVEVPLLDPPAPKPPGFWTRLWRRLLRRPENPQPRLSRKRLNLIDVLQTYTATESVGERSGREDWEVAHSSLYCVSAPEGVFDLDLHDRLETEISDRLYEKVGAYIDPGDELTVRCLTSQRLQGDEVMTFLGADVYAPAQNAKPVGWLRFVADPDAPENHQQPALRNGQPAGIYKGQRTLGFVVGQQAFPVTLDLGADTHYDAFVSLRAQETIDPKAPFALSARRLKGGRVPGFRALPDPPPGADHAWQVTFFGLSRPPGRMELCLDDRVSRFHHPNKRPNGPHVEIAALRLAPEMFARKPERLWVEFSMDEALRHSDMQDTHYSLAWHFGEGKAYRYDWFAFRFRPVGGSFHSEFTHDGAAGCVLRRRGGAPLGYLALPSRAQDISYSDAFADLQTYALDWLDATCTVDFGRERQGLGRALMDGPQVWPRVTPDVAGLTDSSDDTARAMIGPFEVRAPAPARNKAARGL